MTLPRAPLRIAFLVVALLSGSAGVTGGAGAQETSPPVGTTAPTPTPATPAPPPEGSGAAPTTGTSGSASSPPAGEPSGATPIEPGVAPSRPVGTAAKPHGDISPWSMFMDADILVKAVMLGLGFASVMTWTIFLGKTVELLLAQRRLRRSLAGLERCGSLREAQVMLGRGRDVTSVLVQQAAQEARLSADIGHEAGLRERVASRFGEVQKTEGRIIRRGMGLLATMGSTAPFVGLFGTVWGIMNSFIGISKSQTTNLAVVAPGIAEALLATAIGLVAAIPAVIVYNHFARATKSYMEAVGRAAGAVGRLLSRDLDRARGRPIAEAAE